MDEYMTVAEVAAGLQVTPKTVRAMVDRGELKAWRVTPKITRIARSDFEALMPQ